jgi:hypothetical protein
MTVWPSKHKTAPGQQNRVRKIAVLTQKLKLYVLLWMGSWYEVFGLAYGAS